MEVKEIPVDKIKIYQNIRSEKKDVSGLMRSMEREGLLHPIGVYKQGEDYILAFGRLRLQAAEKLNWKTIRSTILPDKFAENDFLTKNTVENIHRSDVTPTELGRICKLFVDKGFSKSEIASKLHLPTTRVRVAYDVYVKTPKKYRDWVGFIGRGEKNRGKIPAEVARAIIYLRMSEKDKDEIFKEARKQELSVRQVNLIGKIMRGSNISTKEAIKNLKNYIVANIILTLNVDQYDKSIKDKGITVTSYVKEIIEGKRPPNESLLAK